MNVKSLYKKIALILVLIMSFSSATAIGYSYWDSLDQSESNIVNVGNWGTPITNAQEFYDFATNSNSLSTDRYYLFNDIDFTGFSWVLDNLNSTAVFRGTLDGNGHSLNNLTIYSDDSYSSIGIFPFIEGASIYNLTLNNVNVELGPNAIGGRNYSSGLIAGTVNGLTNIVNHITVNDSTVMGTSVSGVGGLIGSVNGTTSIVNVDNVIVSNLKVFNTNSNVGGLIGSINDSGAQVNINDLDLQGEVFSASSRSYAGGVIGQISSGGIFRITRGIIEITLQNTFVNEKYYLHYSQKFSGGVIGHSFSSTDLVSISDVLFTGSLFTDNKRAADEIGTAIGRTKKPATITNSFYSQVIFRDSSGAETYILPSSASGVSFPVVNVTTLPSVSWWNNFALNFDTDFYWNQDSITGRLFLVR